MSNFEDFKVVVLSCTVILLSYIKIPFEVFQDEILNTPVSGIDLVRYGLCGITFLYTLRKWWLMEKKNKKDKQNETSN